MNKDRPYSPSQIETFLQCQRKWAWNYVVKIPKEENTSAQFGTIAHEHMAAWFRNGKVPPQTPEGLAALAAMPMWPAPHDGMRIEFPVAAEMDGWYYHGIQDIGYASIDLDPISGDFEVPFVVGDHKFTSDHKWAKTEEILLEDPQAQIYALASMQRNRSDSAVLRWVYTTMRRPRPKLVQVAVERGHCEFFVRDRLNPVAKEIYHLSLVKDLNPNDLPPTVSHCSAYGGCPHIGRCALTAEQKFEGAIMEQTMAEKLQAMVAKQKGQAALNPPAPTAAAPTASGGKLMEMLSAKKSATPSAAGEVTPPVPIPLALVSGPLNVGSLTLFIDATYGKGGTLPVFASALVDRAQEALRAKGVPNYRSVDFGKGAGLLAEELRKVLPGVTGTVILNTSSRPELDMVDVFISAASTVIRGT